MLTGENDDTSSKHSLINTGMPVSISGLHGLILLIVTFILFVDIFPTIGHTASLERHCLQHFENPVSIALPGTG